MPHIYDVMALSEKAVQVSCYVRARFVFVRHSEVRSRLPVKKTEFAQFGVTQPMQAMFRALCEPAEMFPVFAPLLDPGD